MTSQKEPPTSNFSPEIPLDVKDLSTPSGQNLVSRHKNKQKITRIVNSIHSSLFSESKIIDYVIFSSLLSSLFHFLTVS